MPNMPNMPMNMQMPMNMGMPNMPMHMQMPNMPNMPMNMQMPMNMGMSNMGMLPMPFNPMMPPQQQFPPNMPPMAAPHGGDSASSYGLQARTHVHLPLWRKHLTRMTNHDIVFVICSQLGQIQTTDPLADEFYFQVHNARKGQPDIGTSAAIVSAIQRHPNLAYRNLDGSPKLPEGTLGRIAASSVRKPRKLLNVETEMKAATESKVKADDTKAEEPKQEDVKKHMFSVLSLPFLIEEGMRCLMDLEDIDTLISTLESAARFDDPNIAFQLAQLKNQSQQLLIKLGESLEIVDRQFISQDNPFGLQQQITQQHLVFRFLQSPKGRLFLHRSLLFAPPTLGYQIVKIFLWNLKLAASPDSPQKNDEKLAKLSSEILFSLSLAELNECFELFVNPRNVPNMTSILTSTMGCSFAQVFMKKAHEARIQLQPSASSSASTSASTSSSSASTSSTTTTSATASSSSDAAALSQWRDIFGKLVEILPSVIPQLFKNVPPTKDDKKGASVDEVPVTVASLSTRWELLAAILSHASKEQRVLLSSPIAGVLTSGLVTAQSLQKSDSAQALSFLITTTLPANHALVAATKSKSS